VTPDDGAVAGSMAEPGGRLRIDKWLWHARFFKSRTLAAKSVASGRVRVNRTVVRKANHAVQAGDILTFPLGPHIRVIRIAALGARRGPASEAQTLYADLDPPRPRDPSSPSPPVAAARDPGSGRPTKRDRRQIDRLKQGETYE
jgi:ribosome-associated heat shock protein Hsp15